jgi:hypothetical protein
LKYEKLSKLSIRSHTELSERWVQERIAEDPSILGLGDVILKDKERIQSGAGRLDLLLQEADANRRYEVEIQLGRTDESHIIRTIEYWDIERKRYPQYEAGVRSDQVLGRTWGVRGQTPEVPTRGRRQSVSARSPPSTPEEHSGTRSTRSGSTPCGSSNC